MNPAYEAEVLRHLAAFFASGNVYKGKRPVHWCPACKTALAEAEIDYKDKTSPSIYVKFPVVSDLSRHFAGPGRARRSRHHLDDDPLDPAGQPGHRLPSRARLRRAGSRAARSTSSAQRLMPVVAEICGLEDPKVLAVFPGRALEGLKARHPFIDRDSLFVLAEYVTPRGRDGRRPHRPGPRPRRLPDRRRPTASTSTPRRRRGPLHCPRSPSYAGLNVFKANRIINDDMKKDGSLLHEKRDHPFLSALLALQEPGHLPGHRPVVHLHGHERPAGARPSRRSSASAGSPPGARSASPA